jgi:hypothetical protein
MRAILGCLRDDPQVYSAFSSEIEAHDCKWMHTRNANTGNGIVENFESLQSGLLQVFYRETNSKSQTTKQSCYV